MALRIVAGFVTSHVSRPSFRGAASGVRTLTRASSARCTTAILLAFALAPGPWAQAWTSDHPVKGNSSGAVSDVQVVEDRAGGTYTCWADNRYGNYDVFVQHLNASGAVVSGWPTDGIDVSPILG